MSVKEMAVIERDFGIRGLKRNLAEIITCKKYQFLQERKNRSEEESQIAKDKFNQKYRKK